MFCLFFLKFNKSFNFIVCMCELASDYYVCELVTLIVPKLTYNTMQSYI